MNMNVLSVTAPGAVMEQKTGSPSGKNTFGHLLEAMIADGDVSVPSEETGMPEEEVDLIIELLHSAGKLLNPEETISEDILDNDELLSLLSHLYESEHIIHAIQEGISVSQVLEEGWPEEIKLALLSAHGALINEPEDESVIAAAHEGNHENAAKKLIQFISQSPVILTITAQAVQGNGDEHVRNSGFWRVLLTKVKDFVENAPAKPANVQSFNQREIAEGAFTRQFNPLPQTPQQIVTMDQLNQPFNAVQQHVIHTGEQRQGSQQLHDFIKQFENILASRAFKQTGQGVQQLSIKLYPEHLGRLDVTLTRSKSVMTATIMASTTAARDLIESQLQHLRQAFNSQQLPVDRIEVTQQQGFKEKQEQEDNGRDTGPREERDEEKQEADFKELLNDSINEKV
ncbi:flagellar hook-length control protein FliK [Bacillus sp. H-16]|uniref:flagellar hook-length control protein FliK n=1 Tax=Alteribacter salitolerans TaxID=2912333 RepID=UPI0019642EB6|nr:flagellar hook-length control protein FliK [Alteribacter salitolerans]MBM7094176.1 flagellar hook-length control protein FliK [Alteribacter salitolerans]